MKVINASFNHTLQQQSHHFCRGYLTGPARIICGIAQVAINAIGALFTVLPSVGGLISNDSPFRAGIMADDGIEAVSHIVRGIIEFLPGTSFVIDNFMDIGSINDLRYHAKQKCHGKTIEKDHASIGRSVLAGSSPCKYVKRKLS